MNELIASKLLTTLEDIAWLDKTAGLVKPITFSLNTKDGAVDRIFPVACVANYAECTKKGKYNDLVPDSAKKSVLYFEDEGITFTEGGSAFYNAESHLKLVVWLNLAKLGQATCSLSALAMAEIMGRFPLRLPDESPLFGIQVWVTSQMIKDNSIFSKYSYEEKVNQYLMYPYDYFALDLTVKYRIVKQCYLPVEPEPEFCP